MAVSLRRRGTGVLALAMAGGLSLAAAAPAGAASNNAPAYYQGVTSANVLSVALNLPIALPGVPQAQNGPGRPSATKKRKSKRKKKSRSRR